MDDREPVTLGAAIAQLVALRGFARAEGARELDEAWNHVTEPHWRSQSRPLRIARGTLHVGVSQAPLFSELQAFHLPRIIEQLNAKYPKLGVRKIKLQLEAPRPSRPA